MLKNVNREYSATLRGQAGEEQVATLEGLKRQRVALMSSIAELRGHRGAVAIARCAPVGESLVNEPLTEAAR
jgi:hypothetical protein